MKRNVIFLLAILGVPLLLAGCNTNEETLSEYLGVKVLRKGAADDYCLSMQLVKFVEEFDDLSREEQKAIHDKMQKYKEIDLMPSEPRKVLVGVKTELNYKVEECGNEEYCHDECPSDSFGREKYSCDLLDRYEECHTEYVCEDTVNQSKVLLDAVEEKGTDLPLVTVKDVITLSPSEIDDQVKRSRYVTSSETFFNRVSTVNDSAFQSAVENGLLENKTPSSLSGCGTSLTIQEFVKALD